MKFKGTKGKLKIKECYYSNPMLSIETDKKEFFATVPMRDSSMHRFGYEMYNALLISKAPEMLEMLDKVAHKLYSVENPSTSCRILADEIMDLIKEATTL